MRTRTLPRRRARVRMLDAAVSVVNRMGVARVDLDPDVLIDEARGRTGLDDLGDPWFRSGLDAYLWSLRAEAQLSPLGRTMAASSVAGLLENRLRVESDISADPAIEQAPVTAPIVIVGLPRSGTTVLQHVLGCDASNRSLRHWEAARPSPPPVDGPEPDIRIERTAREIARLYRLAPDARVVHPQYAQLPTECVFLMALSFASFELATMHATPSYLDWLVSTDLTPAYREHRRVLQLLQHRHRRDRWVLKSPAHLFALDALLATYPDARLVFLRRDPRKALGSFCSLTMILNHLTSRRVDPHALGQRWFEAWGTAVDRAEVVRRSLAEGAHCVDVSYEELVDDTVGTVDRIYDRFGIPLSNEAEAAMRRFLARNGQNRHGRHRYALGDFGLNDAQVRERFGSWVGVPS